MSRQRRTPGGRHRAARGGGRWAGVLVDVVLLALACALFLAPQGPVRPRLSAWLEARRAARAVDDLWPRLIDGDAVLGGPDAPHVLVEFTDYRCPWCGRAQAELDRLLERRPDVRVVVRHLPLLALHPDAGRLARVAACAADDPAFPALHRELFDAPPGPETDPSAGPGDEALRPVLEGAGIGDPGAVLRCAAGTGSRATVDADLALARTLGLTGTPTFLAPGGRAVGALSSGELLEMLGLADR